MNLCGYKVCSNNCFNNNHISFITDLQVMLAHITIMLLTLLSKGVSYENQMPYKVVFMLHVLQTKPNAFIQKNATMDTKDNDNARLIEDKMQEARMLNCLIRKLPYKTSQQYKKSYIFILCENNIFQIVINIYDLHDSNNKFILSEQHPHFILSSGRELLYVTCVGRSVGLQKKLICEILESSRRLVN